MQHNSFGDSQCPIARSLERVGECWNILILREAFLGAQRFDEFHKKLGIAPNMLSRRLRAMVEHGLLEKRPYSTRPVRHEYLLTQAGRDFRPVLWALMAWGNRYFAPEGPAVHIVNSATGVPADPLLIDRASGQPLAFPAFRVVAGPAADSHTLAVHPVWPATTPAPAPVPGTEPQPADTDADPRVPALEGCPHDQPDL
ncbi:winged helix-turn-helix transcriptional regulator [Nitrospirillum pindoramense]|uniref:HxlR family transcriptional regulator n=1 Tax=Nitrospirillum amazonense TaxID=28077 RepID=A0A560HL80_9PROT|nr:winged helix-turn-helix transcriptional regulator [Nitrospirillum amazonense]TWB46084.1 HxlR family transcriptional regulator [Nitrospirillum amazonense]